MIPPLAQTFLPLLLATQLAVWPAAPMPSFLAAQVEQESCIRLTHPKCWNPRAELKTSREYGFGIGQITTAYRADGSVRFNKFAELKQQHDSLRDWQWDDRYDARYQFLALIEMNKALFERMRGAASEGDQLSFALAAYNGGESGVMQDRTLCRRTPACDPAQWLGHVERTSLKSKVKWNGYGKSAFEINREYVWNVLYVRRSKYVPYMEQT